MKESNIREKSFAFAVRVVKLYQYLAEKRVFVLSEQMLRSGTAVGAMIREAEHAESKPDFIHKMAIAQKEINETIYWLELLAATELLTKQEFESIYNDAVELIKTITTIIKSTKQNLTTNN
ncbi:MAG TPA: four helix bundle protein [Chitinophagales bacterium]|nr:four helix bundle protein [Chitinophagales bacterium]HRK27567.1 four helix bundle protein [Chitinophagales bacterium]